MAFLKTLFWIVLTVVIVVFSFNNWVPIEINLFSNLVWQTRLPVPLMLAFLIGFVPLYLWHRSTRWHQGRKRVAAEQALAAVVAAPTIAPAAPIDGTRPAQAD